MVGSYATLAKVHEILLLAITDTTIDTEINDQMLSANAWVEDVVQIYGVVVPIPNPIPQTIIDAASYYTAMLIRRSRDFASQEVSLFEKIANQLLSRWMAGTQAPITSSGTVRPKEL